MGGVGLISYHGDGVSLYHSPRSVLGDSDGDHPTLDDDKIISYGDSARFLQQYRGDTLSDISSGLNVVASGIRVITTILSLLGAQTVDR